MRRETYTPTGTSTTALPSERIAESRAIVYVKMSKCENVETIIIIPRSARSLPHQSRVITSPPQIWSASPYSPPSTQRRFLLSPQFVGEIVQVYPQGNVGEFEFLVAVVLQDFIEAGIEGNGFVDGDFG